MGNEGGEKKVCWRRYRSRKSKAQVPETISPPPPPLHERPFANKKKKKGLIALERSDGSGT